MSESREGRASKLERPEYIRLRELLAHKLAESGMSQRELGKALGMSTSYFNKLLLGKRTIELTELFDICAKLDLDPAQVISQIK